VIGGVFLAKRERQGPGRPEDRLEPPE
jgi:hypothetical protein